MRAIRFAPLLIVFLVSCAFMHVITEPVSQESRYFSALHQFNDLLDDYLLQYSLASPATQQKWKESLTPAFLGAGSALDIWGVALRAQTGSSHEQEKVFIDARKQIITLLLEYGILEVEDDTD